IVPAHVGFLAIFNPSLGNTDETLDDQIVYYSSVDVATQKRRRHTSKRGPAGRPTENVSQAERNERLRQIGLAQGIVNFGKSFSGDQAVDTIETEKTRVVLHELEPGWWILACIDLTRLPVSSTAKKQQPGDAEVTTEANFEYSSREVKPAALLLQDLLRAHSTFLMHHDSSLSALFVRIKQAKFTSTLSRYWDLYLSTWNVLLHGNPVRDVFGGVKIAASGELGIGVGEEDRGSGEREVLESLKGRIDGLVDLVVSKFGDGDPDDMEKSGEDKKQQAKADPQAQWLGTGREPGAEDGAIFLGVGILSRKSVRDITYWMEDMYRWGENAYGVSESPKAIRRRPAKTSRAAETTRKKNAPTSIQVPPSLFDPNRGSRPVSNTPSPPDRSAPSAADSESSEAVADEVAPGLEKYIDYLKLGYGKYWSLGREATSKDPEPAEVDDTEPNRPKLERTSSKGDDITGHFLIGLTGEVEDSWVEDPEERSYAVEQEEHNARTMVRTLTVELETPTADKPEAMFTRVLGSHDTDLSARRRLSRRGSFDSQDRNKTQRLRVVVYVVKPFMFTLLFELRTESLSLEGLYRSLHHQLAPLRKSLASSTAYRPDRPDVGRSAAAIYDLVWDPKAVTVHSTIPSIPDPAEPYNEQSSWSRVDAINTHMQILNLWKTTRASATELERTCKTSRGWWIVWSRILERKDETSSSSSSSSTEVGRPSSAQSNDSIPSTVSRMSTTPQGAGDEVSKEIFLLRKASDHSGHSRSISLAGAASGTGWADGASRLAQGIGVDTRKYIEGLLSL
ncbi:hypothetical protein M406DRAFT_216763, partial [Cryphonectria parasitica EP155]